MSKAPMHSVDELPAKSNFFGTLETKLTRQQVARLFEECGWSVRKCSTMDFEISSDWAELVIESTSPILMHGAVAGLPHRADELLAPLRVADISFTAECYGPDQQLVSKFRHPTNTH